jgi:hypothetical protein
MGRLRTTPKTLGTNTPSRNQSFKRSYDSCYLPRSAVALSVRGALRSRGAPFMNGVRGTYLNVRAHRSRQQRDRYPVDST